ncbi:MAG: LysR family transcriptional regulator [Solirubrobacteraceae bacterium]
MLDVRRLRVLRELAARGTVAATADALGYTAPAVSQQLAALEREAGVALLERNGRRRRLTPAGEELVARTEGILRELEAAEAALARTTTHVAGVLRCGAFASAHRALLPPAIAALAGRHPDLRVSTRELEPEESLPALKLGELDLAIAQEHAFGPTPDDPALERTDLLEDPLRVALPAGHRLATNPSIELAALATEPWIAGRDGSFCHDVVLLAARAAGFEPKLAHITNEFSVAYALVAASAAVALVPELAGPPPPGVVVRPVQGRSLSRHIYAAVRAGSSARPAVAALLQALAHPLPH